MAILVDVTQLWPQLTQIFALDETKKIVFAVDPANTAVVLALLERGEDIVTLKK